MADDWIVVTHGGRNPTKKYVPDWAREIANRGGGEILLTSMENDGTKNGFALDITAEVTSAVSIPVIASGGAGTMEHFHDVFTRGKADAALAASIFHFSAIHIIELKEYLKNSGIPVRL